MDILNVLFGLLFGALGMYFWLNTKLQKKIIELSANFAAEQEKTKFITNVKEEFKSLAGESLEFNKDKLKQKNTQTIDPLKEEIKNFRERLENISKEQSDDRSALKQQIQTLADLSKNTIKGAEKLANALTYDNKQQGDWGEMVLETILQNSGLKKPDQYEVQKVYKDESGKVFRPDIIVHLPDKKDIVIDSKVSLVAYQNYINGNDEADLKAHIQSVEKHIKDISLKGYENLHALNTLDYIFVFFPIEASLFLTMEHKPDLFSDAIKKNVALVSPSTLMMSLKIVHHIWQTERQNKHTDEIVRLSGAMLDKLAGFVDSLEAVNVHLEKATDSYIVARNRLNEGKGNIFSIASKIKTLGVSSKKELK